MLEAEKQRGYEDQRNMEDHGMLVYYTPHIAMD